MTGDDPVDPDATPPYGIVSRTAPNRFVRTRIFWFLVVGVVLALFLLILVISLA